MAKTTAIQWCDSTVNSTMGCDGCELWSDQRRTCYAGRLHRRHGGHNSGYAPTFEQMTEFEGRTSLAGRWSDLRGTDRPNKRWLNGLPRHIFVSDMSDALSKTVPFDFLLREILRVAGSEAGRLQVWLWLTKRPGRMVQFSEWLEQKGIGWPANLWAGTSITTRKTLTRLTQLRDVGDETTRRFVSLEPQWEQVSLADYLLDVHWVIQGGESGTKEHVFQTEWADQVRSECRKARVPYFLKQLGAGVLHRDELLSLRDGHGGDWVEWPKSLRVRQMPRPR